MLQARIFEQHPLWLACFNAVAPWLFNAVSDGAPASLYHEGHPVLIRGDVFFHMKDAHEAARRLSIRIDKRELKTLMICCGFVDHGETTIAKRFARPMRASPEILRELKLVLERADAMVKERFKE